MRCGDLIFFKSTGSWVDHLTRKVSPTYTHVGMLVDHDHYIESSRKGVRIQKINRAKADFDIFTFDHISQRRRTQAALLGAKHIGENYPYFSVLSVGVCEFLNLPLPQSKSKYKFCSEFITYLIRDPQGMNLAICPELDLEHVLPDKLAASKLLRKQNV